MKIALTLVASLALVACSAGNADPGNTTTGGGATTAAVTTTTTSSTGTGSAGSTGVGTTSGSSSSGGTTGQVFSGACKSNAWTCAQGTAMAGAVYPGAAPANCGAGLGQTFPDVELFGGGVLNFAKTQTKDDMSLFSSDPIWMHDLFCSGFRYTLVDISGVWCYWCNVEAGEIPNKAYHPSSLYQAWLDKGGTVFSILVQGDTSTSATESDMSAWIDKYQTPYPLALDTYQTMVQFGDVSGWPLNFVVDLGNMQVAAAWSGDNTADYVNYCQILGVTDCPTK